MGSGHQGGLKQQIVIAKGVCRIEAKQPKMALIMCPTAATNGPGGSQYPDGAGDIHIKVVRDTKCVLAIVIAFGRLSIESGQVEVIRSSLEVNQAKDGRDEPKSHIQNWP